MAKIKMWGWRAVEVPLWYLWRAAVGTETIFFKAHQKAMEEANDYEMQVCREERGL